MQTTTLGRTGLTVSVMGLGCGGHSRLGLATGGDEASAIRVVRRALDLGVNFIDTAESYGTEDAVGKALAGVARESVVISTKIGPERDGVLIDAAELTARLDRCLARLKTDYVDVLHLHGVAPEEYDHCRDELVPALQALQTAGKVRFPGITEVFSRDTGHAMLTRALDDDAFDVIMVGFNVLNQSARERVLAITRAKDVGTLCMFACRRALSRSDALGEALDALIAEGKLAAAARDAFPAEGLTDFAYRFCRHEPGLDVILSGTGSVAHLEQNAASLLAPPLPEETVETLRRLFAGIDSVSGN